MEYLGKNLALPGGRRDLIAFGDQAGGPLVGDDLAIFRKMIGLVFCEEELGFILNINQNKNDPTVRLVYADWLEERGRMQEAVAEREAAEVLGKANKASGFVGGLPGVHG